MTDKYILDENGNPRPEPDLIKWGQWFETNNRRIAYDEIGDVRVSTVFLGLDHAHGHGEPLIFETMIFGSEHDGFQTRYSTKEEALAGHQAALDRVKFVIH